MEPNVDRGMWSVVVLLMAIVIGGVVLLAFPKISGKIANSMDDTVNKAFSGETPEWVVQNNKEEPPKEENKYKTYKDLLYSETKNTVTIHGFDKESDEFSLNNKMINIPDTINGKPVTLIAMNAFRGESHVTGLELGKNVHKLGLYSFYNTKIEKFNANDNLKIIQGGAFERVALKEIELNEGLEVIEWFAFYINKAEEVVIPKTVKRLENNTFTSSALKRVKISKNTKFVPSESENRTFSESTVVEYID